MWAFVDESGDPNLHVAAGATTHFAICAICVPDEELATFRSAAETIRERYFQKGEIKSKLVGTKNRKRRLEILRAMAEGGYRGYALVLDKERLRRDTGLEYRGSFMKYFSRVVYDPLLRAHPHARIVADRHGTESFMASFIAYHRKRHRPADDEQLSLELDDTRISFAESSHELGIQWADFVSGSLRIAYSEPKEGRFREIYDLVRPQLMGLQLWPPGRRSDVAPRVDVRESSIGPLAIERAETWVREHDESDDEHDDKRRIVLLALLDAAYGESPYLTLDALHERVQALGHDVSRDFVRRKLIASLRDDGAVIVSSSQGYCIPREMGQVETYLDRMQEEVVPILRRIGRIDETLRIASLNRLRVLDRPRYVDLRRLVETSEATAREED